MAQKRKLNVHLYVIPTCNLRCKHCYYDALGAKDPINNLLSIDQLHQIITELYDTYHAAFDIEGGEFFLRSDIYQLFEVVPETYWKSITITTNGTLPINIHPDKLRVLDELRVSVEGHTDDLQMNLRGIKLTPVLRTCEQLLANGVPVTLRITIHRKNYHLLDEMLSTFLSLGFTRFSLYEFQATGRGRSHETEYALDMRQIENVIYQLSTSTVAAYIDVLKLSLSARRVPIVHTFKDNLEQNGLEIVDLSGAMSMTINYNGDIGVCPWYITNKPMGTFQSAGFLEYVNQIVEERRLDHHCQCCSMIRIRNRTM